MIGKSPCVLQVFNLWSKLCSFRTGIPVIDIFLRGSGPFFQFHSLFFLPILNVSIIPGLTQKISLKSLRSVLARYSSLMMCPAKTKIAQLNLSHRVSQFRGVSERPHMPHSSPAANVQRWKCRAKDKNIKKCVGFRSYPWVWKKWICLSYFVRRSTVISC